MLLAAKIAAERDFFCTLPLTNGDYKRVTFYQMSLIIPKTTLMSILRAIHLIACKNSRLLTLCRVTWFSIR